MFLPVIHFLRRRNIPPTNAPDSPQIRQLAVTSALRSALSVLLFSLFVLLGFVPQIVFSSPPSPETQKIHNTKVRFNKGLLSVQTEGVALGVLMEEVSRKADIAVSINASLKDEKVTVQFEDVPFESGLKTILRSAGVVNNALVYQQSKEPGKVGQWLIEKIFLKQKGTSKSAPIQSKGSANKPKGITSFEKEPFFDKKLDRFVEVVKAEVMVRFKKGLTDEEIEKFLKELDATVIRKNQLKVYRLKIPADVSVSEFIEQHGKNEILELIEPNFIASILSTQTIPPNDPSLAPQWAITKIQAEKAWEVTTGSPEVVVAILDTGIEMTHQDLVNKVLPGRDIVNNDPDPSDDHGHGTHVAGIVAAEANNRLGIAGISWDSTLLPVKVITSSGEGAYSDVMDGILYAVDKDARVLNFSIGGYSYSQVLGDAVEYAHTKGAVIVAAGGNEDSSDPIYPAAYPNVIGVSATDPADQIWTPSNQGTYIKLSAPGIDILSTALGNVYVSATGTSASTAHVSGVASLILSKNPDFSNTQVEQILYQTADDLGEAGLDPEFGYGRLNAAKALEVASIEVHDLAVTHIRVEPQSFKIGEPTQIIVTVQNQGTFVEDDLSVTTFMNDGQIEEPKQIEIIKPGESLNVGFAWVASINAGEEIVLSIKSDVSVIKGETDLTDNVKTKVFIASQINGLIIIKHKSEPDMQTHQYLVGEAAKIWPGGYVTDSNHHEIWEYIGEKVEYDLNDAAVLSDTHVTTYGGRFNGEYVKSPFNPRTLPCSDPRHISTICSDSNDHAVPYSELNKKTFSIGTGTNDLGRCGERGPENLSAGSCTNGGDDIIEGVMEEDYFAIVNLDEHSDQFFGGGLDANGACIYLNHLWNRPNHNGTGDTGLTGVARLPSCGQSTGSPHTPYQMAQEYWNMSITKYKEGNKGLAYYYLGRVAHFLTDMTVPAHAHADNHGNEIVGGVDSYENFMGENYTKYTYNSTPEGSWTYNVGDIKYNDYATVTTGGGFTGFGTDVKKWRGTPQSWDEKTELYHLFWYTAEIADNFDSDGVAGEVSNGIYQKVRTCIINICNITPCAIGPCIIEETNLKTIGKVLMPLAMKATAELYKLFWDTVQPLTITSSLKLTPESVRQAVGATLSAQFVITNTTPTPVTVARLTVKGVDPDNITSDFPAKTCLTLQPNVPYKYEGTLKLTKAGVYSFVPAYETPTTIPQCPLPDGNWNTDIPAVSGIVNGTLSIIASLDNTAPAVNITAPLNGETVSGIPTVAASATDSMGISKVEFYLDSVRQVIDSSSPYLWSWNTTGFANKNYSLYAIAYDTAGNQKTSPTLSVTVNNTITDTTAPNISSLSASATGTTATISWITNEPANSQLEYGTSPCPCLFFLPVDSIFTTNHSMRLTGLTPLTRYYYRVFSRDAAGNRAFSNNNFFSTSALGNVAPSVVVGRPNGGENFPAGSVQNIQWTATDDVGVTSVSLSYSTDGGSQWIDIPGGTNIDNSGNFSWTLPDIASSSVRVSVSASDGVMTGSDASNGNFSISQTCSLPLIPTLQSISASGRSYTVTWGNVSGASSYILEEDTTSSFGSPTRRSLTQASIFFSEKPAGTYFYRVKAVNSCGESALWSQTKSVSIQSNFGPGEITATSPTDNAINQNLTVNLCWSASHPGGESLRYNVYLTHSDTEFFFPHNIKSSGQTSSCYSAANLPYNTRISWGIESIDDTGDSRVSPMFHFNTLADSTPPTGSIVINNGDETSDTYSVTLHLSASDTDSGIQYMRFSNDGINWSFWVGFASQYPWNLADSRTGGKLNQTSYTVFAQFRDNQENESATFSDTIDKVASMPGNILLNGKLYETIQDAVDAAQPGETVFLTEGTYTITGNSKPPRYPSRSVGLVMQPGVTLMGAGAEKTTIILEGIGLWTLVDADNAVVEGLTLINSDSGGVRYAVLLESDSAKIKNSIIRGSDGGIAVGGGVALSNPTNVEISNNLITGNGEGIRVNSGTNISILHNTISHNSNSCGICPNASSIIRNNIISFNGNGIATNGEMPTLSHNNVFGNINNNISNNYQGIPDQTGINQNMSADPGFINATTSNFRLSSGSPVINAGIDVGIPFMGPAPDMGAYEFGGVGTLNVPSNRIDAAFTVTGPQSFSGSGTSTVFANVPLGVYSITFSPIGGHYSPPYQSQIVMSNQTVTFDGTYNADTIPPFGTVSANYDEFATADPLITISLDVLDDVAGMGPGAEMMFSNDGVDWSTPEPYSSLKKGWDLTAFGGGTDSGTRTVFVKVSDAFGNLMTSPITDTILYVPNRSVLEVPTQFPSIQAAVDVALSGDMVYVLPGTYHENVVLKAGIRLQGAGPGATILENISTNNITAITDAPDTAIDGFTLKSHRGRAINCQNRTLIISNNMIEALRGIDAVSGCKAIIRNNLIQGRSSGYGIIAFGDLSIILENNTIVSTAPVSGSPPPNGIDLENGVPTTRIFATNNIIANNRIGVLDNGLGDPNHQHIFSSFNTYWNNVDGHLVHSAGSDKLLMGPGDTIDDPLFTNPNLVDFSLQAGSPGIDRGHLEPRYNDTDGSRNDRGAYGGQGSNTPPQADFITKPSIGNVGSLFVFDAGISFDKETAPSELWVRWDLDGNGQYETPWTTQKTIPMQFSNVGVFTIGLQVRDKGWFSSNTAKQVTVLNQPPNIPSNPSPADNGVNQPIGKTFAWSGGDPDPLDTVTYDLYFGTSTEPPLVSNDQPLATYDPGPLAFNTFYYWRIVATDNWGNSITGHIWRFLTLPEPAPQPPAGLAAIVVSDSQINLSWTDTDKEIGFKIERKTGESGTYSQVDIVDSDVTFYNDSNLSSGANYTYRVRSYNGSGHSAYSNEASATTGQPSSADNDNDGLPDSFEMAHGLNPNDPLDALRDSDGDSYTNLEEFLGGTDPRNAASHPIRPFVVEASPHDGQGIVEDTRRVPIDSSIAIRIKDEDDGIDPNSILMTVEEVGVQNSIRTKAINNAGFTDIWVIYDTTNPDTDNDGRPDIFEFAFDQEINIRIEVRDTKGIAMNPYEFSFKVESEQEHNNAMATMPRVTTSVDPTSGITTIEAAQGSKIEGAKILFNTAEPVTPRFGPVDEIPPLTVAGGVGFPLNLEPPTVFDNPVTLFVPVPGGSDLSLLSLYVFTPERGWRLASEVEGWMLLGSRVDHPDTTPPTIEVQVNHFTSVQAAEPPPAPPSPPELVFPADGQTGLGTTVTFGWNKSEDSNADTITYSLTVCEDSSFTGCSPEDVAKVVGKSTYYAGLSLVGLIVGMVMIGGVKGRRKIGLFIAGIIITASFVTSCDGGGGGGGKTPLVNVPPLIEPLDADMTLLISDLKPGTTYHWKVTADDDKGGITDSETRSFTTAP